MKDLAQKTQSIVLSMTISYFQVFYYSLIHRKIISTIEPSTHKTAYFHKLNAKIKELPELERKIIENIPMDGNLYRMFNQENDDSSKTVYDYAIRRRLETGNSHSPLLRKSQIK